MCLVGRISGYPSCLAGKRAGAPRIGAVGANDSNNLSFSIWDSYKSAPAAKKKTLEFTAVASGNFYKDKARPAMELSLEPRAETSGSTSSPKELFVVYRHQFSFHRV